MVRGFSQARKNIQELIVLMLLMREIPSCKYGLWTNGPEILYLEKNAGLIDPISDWPPSEAIFQAQNTSSRVCAHRADPELLRITIRRCKILLRGNEGMPVSSTFWQLLYLFFCKIYDESLPPSRQRFWVGLKEQFEVAGRKQIWKRILSLFREVKENYEIVFGGNEEITLSERALAFTVSELARYDFSKSSLDAKEVAFQEIAELILDTEREQYFTPRSIIQFLVAMLDPGEQERVFDPACGTGGFLLETQRYISEKEDNEVDIASFKDKSGFQKANKIQLESHDRRIFGADIDPFLTIVAKMHMALIGFGEGNFYQIDSLFLYKSGGDAERARSNLLFDTFDIIMTNPPFSSRLVATLDKDAFSQFELTHIWERKNGEGFVDTGELHKSVPKEILFLERSLQWLRPGGRLGIVLPTSILSNSLYEYVRWWLLQKAWVLAIVDLPADAFISVIGTKILTSLVFLRKKTSKEIRQEVLQGETDYLVFMALAEAIENDSRKNKAYRSELDDKELQEIKNAVQELRAEEKILEEDLRVIVQKYREFLAHQIDSGNLPYAIRKD